MTTNPSLMGLSRRQALSSIGGLLTAASLPQAAARASAATETTMRPLGIQLYMLKGPLASDFPGTLDQVAAIGYREVEFASFDNRTGAEIRRALDQACLKCPSAHVQLDSRLPGSTDLANPGPAIEILHAIGATQAVVAVFPLARLDFTALRNPMDVGAAIWRLGESMSIDDWKAFARRLNETGQVLAKEGLRVGYHNHNLEYRRLSDGSTPLEILIRETDPALVNFELDVGWAATAGVDPAAFIRTHAGRINQLHLKDIAARTGTSFGFAPSAVGAGIMDWASLMEAVKRSPRIEHLYVEQEEPFTHPALEEARVAFEFLAKRPELARG